MGILSSKPFVVIDLGSGRYVQTKVGHDSEKELIGLYLR